MRNLKSGNTYSYMKYFFGDEFFVFFGIKKLKIWYFQHFVKCNVTNFIKQSNIYLFAIL